MKINTSKLNKAYIAFNNEIVKIEKILNPYLKFSFFITYQEGHGTCVVHSETATNARLEDCLFYIEKNGQLTEDEYFKLTI